MLIKLIKHELIATYRTYLTIYLGAFSLSIMIGLMSFLDGMDLIFIALLLIAFSVFIGTVIIFIIQTIRMFDRDLYSPHGYLTLTLPVPTWQILMSKIITLLFWLIMSGLVFAICTFLSFWLVASKYGSINELMKAYTDTIKFMERLGLPYYYYIIAILEFLIRVVYAITLIGFSLSIVSIGWLRKGKKAVAVFIYFTSNQIFNYINVRLSQTLEIGNELSEALQRQLSSYSNIGDLSEGLLTDALFNIAFYLLLGVGFYTLVCWIIDNRIEIE